MKRSGSIDQLTHTHAEPVTNAHPAVVCCYNARTVLITGAGGSIGSEIARQVSALNVDRVVALDCDENAIFELMNEFRDSGCKAIVPLWATFATGK